MSQSEWKKKFREEFRTIDDGWNYGVSGSCEEIESFIESLLAKQRQEVWQEISDLWQRGQFTTEVLANKLRAISTELEKK